MTVVVIFIFSFTDLISGTVGRMMDMQTDE